MNEYYFYLQRYGTYLIYGIVIFLIIKFLFGATLKNYHSRWNTLIDNFDYSPKEFYALLKTELESHGISNIKIKTVHLRETGLVSNSRIYLRATWKDYQYDICGAKFGDGFFISWWLLYKDSIIKILITKIPFVGGWLGKKLYPVTYYRIDTASMFMSYAQSSVQNVIEDITNKKGVRALSETEYKPILNNIFVR